MKTNTADFTIVYDGEALKNSSIDVTDLVPAILAFADLLKEANRTVNGDKASVSVKIKAFKGGCFGIDFSVVQSLTDSVLSFFSQESRIKSAIELLNFLGITPKDIVIGTTLGVFGLIRKYKGKKPNNAIELNKDKAILVYIDDSGKEIEEEVDKEVVSLLTDYDVRKAVSKTLSPLKKDGIDVMKVKSADEAVELADKVSAPFFETPAYEPIKLEIDEAPQERFFTIVSLSFKEDNKWRLTDGSSILNVKISDPDFMLKVGSGEISFTRGDLLKVSLKTTQMQTADGIKTEYEAVRVLAHRKAAKQLPLV